MPIWKSMYSLPSTSQTWQRLPRARYFGATPRTYWPGPLARVWVPAGISPSARAYQASERAMSGKDSSSRTALGIASPLGRMGAPTRNVDQRLFENRPGAQGAHLADLRQHLAGNGRPGEALVREHVGEQRGLEPALAERNRLQAAEHAMAHHHLGHDRVEAAGLEVVLDRHQQAGAARGAQHRRLVDRLQAAHVYPPPRHPLLLHPPPHAHPPPHPPPRPPSLHPPHP